MTRTRIHDVSQAKLADSRRPLIRSTTFLIAITSPSLSDTHTLSLSDQATEPSAYLGCGGHQTICIIHTIYSVSAYKAIYIYCATGVHSTYFTFCNRNCIACVTGDLSLAMVH